MFKHLQSPVVFSRVVPALVFSSRAFGWRLERRPAAAAARGDLHMNKDGGRRQTGAVELQQTHMTITWI